MSPPIEWPRTEFIALSGDGAMIRLHRFAELHHERQGQREAWSADLPALTAGFEPLLSLHEGLIPPGASLPPLAFQDVEVLTYVFEGTVACRDPEGGSGVTSAGEFQRRGDERGYRERNPSRSVGARVYQIVLRPSAGRTRAGRETKRFSIAQRRGMLCLIASQDGRSGSLRIQSRADVYSVILERGRHLAYELSPGRSAWLHIVSGSVQLAGVVLTTGDSAGITGEQAVSLLAQDSSEILLLGLDGSPVTRAS